MLVSLLTEEVLILSKKYWLLVKELEERGLRLFAIEQQDIDEILEREIGKLVAHVESKQGEASIVLGTIK